MSSDLPDDPDGPADRRDDHGGEGGKASGAGSGQAETRSRMEYYVELRTEVAAEETAAAQRTSAREQAAAEKWQEKSGESSRIWEEYQRKWPPNERTQADRPGDQGSSRGDRSGSMENGATNTRVEMECDRIAERERDKISPALRAIESQDPDRHLIGFEHRLKGRDRIAEKVYRGIKNFGRSPEQAVSHIPDAIRYTFEYQEGRYTQGAWTDIGRLKEQGFKLHKLKNSWSDDQYKGLNSQWIDPETGQRFEVQFHTRISFEAKQLTHDAYKRLRTGQADKFEQMVLEAFQRKVTADVPVPPGAAEIPDYP